MITPGKYTVWFRTPVGEGAGVVDFGPMATSPEVIQRSPTPDVGSKTASGSKPPYPRSELNLVRLACLEWTKSI
jgi:hypothetical protein